MENSSNERRAIVFADELRREQYSVIVDKSMSKEGSAVKVMEVFSCLEPDENTYYPSPYLFDLCREGLLRSMIPGVYTDAEYLKELCIDEDTANAIYDRLCEEAPCCFNKSHAAAFSLLIYEMAWLKYHYKSEFQNAVEKYKGFKSEPL